MINFLSAHAKEIWAAILGAIAGAGISIPITVRMTRDSVSGRSNHASQSRASAGGDVVGRDKTTY